MKTSLIGKTCKNLLNILSIDQTISKDAKREIAGKISQIQCNAFENLMDEREQKLLRNLDTTKPSIAQRNLAERILNEATKEIKGMEKLKCELINEIYNRTHVKFAPLTEEGAPGEGLEPEELDAAQLCNLFKKDLLKRKVRPESANFLEYVFEMTLKDCPTAEEFHDRYLNQLAKLNEHREQLNPDDFLSLIQLGGLSSGDPEVAKMKKDIKNGTWTEGERELLIYEISAELMSFILETLNHQMKDENFQNYFTSFLTHQAQ